MTDIYEKTLEAIVANGEFNQEILEQYKDTIMNMDQSELELLNLMLGFVKDANAIAAKQARVINRTDRELGTLKSKKWWNLLNRKG